MQVCCHKPLVCKKKHTTSKKLNKRRHALFYDYVHFKERFLKNYFKRLERTKWNCRVLMMTYWRCNAFFFGLAHTFMLSISHRCLDHTPKLKLWMAAMRKDPTVSALLTDVKTFQGFLKLYLQNSLEACDYGLWWGQKSTMKTYPILPFTNRNKGMLLS